MALAALHSECLSVETKVSGTWGKLRGANEQRHLVFPVVLVKPIHAGIFYGEKSPVFLGVHHLLRKV